MVDTTAGVWTILYDRVTSLIIALLGMIVNDPFTLTNRQQYGVPSVNGLSKSRERLTKQCTGVFE